MNRSLQNIIIAAIFAVAVVSIVLLQAVKSIPAISVEEVHALQNADDSSFVLIDVRTPQEHIDERIARTIVIPLAQLESRVHELDRFKNHKIIVYCRTGKRSGMAAEILNHYRFRVFNMTGGITRWKKAGFTTAIGNEQ